MKKKFSIFLVNLELGSSPPTKYIPADLVIAVAQLRHFIVMHLTSYTRDPDRPCFLLRRYGVTIMLDCPVDFAPFSQFLPHLYAEIPGSRNASTSANIPGCPCVRMIRDNYYIDGLPEVITSAGIIKMDTVDCILISNWNSLVGLPFYVHETGFGGAIYATGPVLQFGRLMMEEIIESLERMPADSVDVNWKDFNIWSKFPNLPCRNPKEFKKFYSMDIMNAVLSQVVEISHRQTIFIQENVAITAYNSGYHIGSSNWIIVSENEKIGYVTSSSLLSTHTKPVDWERFHGLDTLLLTSLKSTDCETQKNSIAILDVIAETLMGRGNVILPIDPVGDIYDLLELVIRCIQCTSGVPLDTPIYFISPVARKSLAASNISIESLNDERQKAVFKRSGPDEPFGYSKYQFVNSLKVYDSLYGAFSKEIKRPCVVFCGHPSLRIGDAPHLLEVWGNDKKHSLIITSPTFSLPDVYGPYEGLNIKVYHYPVDTRIDFMQANNTVIPDLNPKTVYVPDSYTKITNRPDLSLTHPHCRPIRFDETINISNKRAQKRTIRTQSEIFPSVESLPSAVNEEFVGTPLIGYLNIYDDAYEFKSANERIGPLRPKFAGILEINTLLAAFKKVNIDAHAQLLEDKSFEVLLPQLKAAVHVSSDKSKSRIKANIEHRQLIAEIIAGCLNPLC